MLAKHLHHAAVRTQFVVLRIDVGHIAAVGDIQHVLPTVGIVFIRAEQAKVLAFQVELHHIAKKPAHLAGRLSIGCAGAGNFHRVFAEVRHLKVAHEQAAVSVRIVAHPAVTFRGELGDFRLQPTVFTEKLFRSVAFHPGFKDADVLGLIHVAHRHLMTSPVILTLLAIDFRRAGPALRRAEHDHRPGGAFDDAVIARLRPNLFDLADNRVQYAG